MIDIRALEKSPPNPVTGKTYLEEYRDTLTNRGADASLIDRVLELNRERKRLIAEQESKKAEQNKMTGLIAQKKRKNEDASSELEQMQSLSGVVKELDVQAQKAEQALSDVIMTLPNKLHHTTPVGRSDKDNVVVRSVGSAKKFTFAAKEHWQLGEELDMIDFERAAKVTGARFAFLKKSLAHMERALMNFMLDLHTREHGYSEMWPPFMANDKSLLGTGQLPKFAEDQFRLAGYDYYLIPTAEVPVTNYHREEILNEAQLPICYVAYSPCFRAEAGSYGKDTKGLIRQHQFDKVELVQFAHPERSYEQHEALLSHAEKVLQLLEIPYQVAALCSGDIGFGAAKCYDINVWLPGQNAYREISSCSNFEDFQARRANIRFRPADGGKPQFVHTLNGSGLAIGRTLIAILENYQHEDGSIQVPEALAPYMGGLKEIRKEK